jgi:hypothetical protein
LSLRRPARLQSLISAGITAYDEADARRIFEDQVVTAYGSRTIIAMTTDVDVSTLDKGHVSPNMGDPSSRGVWFPLL